MDRFDRRVVVLGSGEARPHDPDEWRDALVVVEHGAVEVEDDAGGRTRFGPGAVVTLDRVAAVSLRNPGPDAAVLRVVARRLRAVS
jgi:hypothetical protein